MEQAISIHIGVSHPKEFCVSGSVLEGAEGDARVMCEIARHVGFTSQMLLGSAATRDEVTKALVKAHHDLAEGGILLVSFSGHGCRVPDGRDDDETDRYDETWCLFDEHMIDDDLYRYCASFQSGIRIVLVSDSCHSESVAKRAARAASRRKGREVDDSLALDRPVVQAEVDFERLLDRDRLKHFDRVGAKLQLSIRASVLLLAACREGEDAHGENRQGAFTTAIAELWDGGRFVGSYIDLISQVRSKVSADKGDQFPVHVPLGAKWQGFWDQHPFTLATP